MQSIERIGGPAPHELNGSDGYIATMRDFLSKPRVARDFQDLKADAEKLRAIGMECASLNERAAEAELDAGRKARVHDEHRHQRLSFPFGVGLATLFVALDALPANLAAQTFGLDPLPTWGITAVMVGALAAGMWAVTHYKSGWPPVSVAERSARILRRRAERKGAQEISLGRRLDAARAEFFADAQLFSFRAFQNDASRNQFLDYVRAQLDR